MTHLPPACRATPAWRHKSDRWRGSLSEPSRPTPHRSGCADCAVVSAKHRTHPARHRAPRTTTPPAIVLVAGGPIFSWAFSVLYGAGNGILTIVRGTLPLAIFGPMGYGRRIGLLAAPARIM